MIWHTQPRIFVSYLLTLLDYGLLLTHVLALLTSRDPRRRDTHILHSLMALVLTTHPDREGLDEALPDARERPDAKMITDRCHDPIPDIYGIHRNTYSDGHMEPPGNPLPGNSDETLYVRRVEMTLSTLLYRFMGENIHHRKNLSRICPHQRPRSLVLREATILARPHRSRVLSRRDSRSMWTPCLVSVTTFLTMNTPFQKQQAGIREALKEGFKSRDVESRTWRQAIRILSTRDIECITTLSVSTLSLGDLLVSKEV